ncbi:MAG: DUF1998 domain-containing protein, partial [Kiritimatiellae bacterium]|nr:DUF1998 domain-containing protein [Kiritimatiellia bacterium]
LFRSLEDWDMARCKPIVEGRLLGVVRRYLGDQVQRMVSPPYVDEGRRSFPVPDESATIGVPVATFPRYLRCPTCTFLAPVDCGLFELRVDARRPERTRYVHVNCSKAPKPPTALPARFLIACERGHLDDFPYKEYVHGGPTPCKSVLELREIGASGEATDVLVCCKTCLKKRTMAEAFSEAGREKLPACRGRRPHLRDFVEKPCDQLVKPILLNASNLWFSVTVTALSLPVGENELDALVDDKWGILADVDDTATLKYLRKQGKLGGFDKHSEDDILAAIKKRTSGEETPVETADLKSPEWALFTEGDEKVGNKDFKVKAVKPPDEFKSHIDRVLLVERLREVTALTGFTRIASPGDLPMSGEKAVQRRVPLTRKPPVIVPASEVRGEGIFLTLNEKRISEWLPRGRDREIALEQAHKLWCKNRRLETADSPFAGLRYVMVHTFSHALMRQLALECGYSAASLKERIYAREADDDGPAMAGLLIYTAAPDSEGTLGGLVSLGQPERLGRHIRNALEAMRLCASDPLCAEHQPYAEEPTLHGAACHACMFSPETSCERQNRFLDRNVLVKTVSPTSWGFFEES